MRLLCLMHIWCIFFPLCYWNALKYLTMETYTILDVWCGVHLIMCNSLGCKERVLQWKMYGCNHGSANGSLSNASTLRFFLHLCCHTITWVNLNPIFKNFFFVLQGIEFRRSRLKMGGVALWVILKRNSSCSLLSR